jgi:nucleoside-diphosphate-sugar epimerase
VRVLLIGGSGFIGRHVARAMLDAGAQVTVLARGQCPPVEGAEMLVADRRDPAALGPALEGRRFDYTVDLAAYDAGDVERLLLVPYAALGRYVLISTGQVYLVTECRRIPCVEEDSDHPLIPEPPPGTRDHNQWVYGTGKRRAEGALLSVRSSHGVRGVILRLPVVLGVGDPTLRTWSYLERLLDGGPIVLPEGGTQSLRFLHVDDVARLLVRLLESPPPRMAVYNLAQPDLVTLRHFVERLAHHAGVTPRLVDASWAELDGSGIDRTFSTFSGRWVSVLDPSRAGSEWGFLGTRMDDYLPGVVRWLLDHRPAESHPGYSQRPLELALAARLVGAAG